MEKIRLSKLQTNNGQIEGLPKNPRFIKDGRFDKLIKSVSDSPEFMNYRPLLVFPFDGKYVCVGGNMRLRACIALKWKEVPCEVLPEDTPIEKLREYAIKDNVAFGNDDWDLLTNEWDEQELDDWGVEWQGVETETEEEAEAEEDDFKNSGDIQFVVEVICKDEQDQNETFSKLDAQGYEVRFKMK